MDGEVDIANDPEVQRLGANSTAQYALQFWNTLAEAARKDGRLFYPAWGEDYSEEAHYIYYPDCNSQGLARCLKLHRRFRSNVGGFIFTHRIVTIRWAERGGCLCLWLPRESLMATIS
jgi:hypothetical protein